MTGSREHEEVPGRIRGHADGAFYNRLAKVLGDYMREVLDELARGGIVKADEDGHPLAVVREARAVFGTARVDLDVHMGPGGLDHRTPLSASWVAGERQINWRMHSAFITTTPCEWPPAEAARKLTRDRLHEAYARFMGREPPGRGRQ